MFYNYDSFRRIMIVQDCVFEGRLPRKIVPKVG